MRSQRVPLAVGHTPVHVRVESSRAARISFIPEGVCLLVNYFIVNNSSFLVCNFVKFYVVSYSFTFVVYKPIAINSLPRTFTVTVWRSAAESSFDRRLSDGESFKEGSGSERLHWFIIQLFLHKYRSK